MAYLEWIVGLVAIFIALYVLYPPFRFNAKMGLFYMYLVVICFLSLPLMIYRGRSTKNLATISWMMNPGRKIFGLKSEIRKWKENMICDRPCIIVSNHQSSLDVFGMAEMYPPRASFMAKQSLLYVGHIGLALWLSGGVFIDRSRHKSAQAVLEHTVEEIHRRKLKLWIFPEGTRGGIRGMLPFKKGAFNIAIMAKTPIVPVVFKSYEDFFCQKEYLLRPGKYIAEVLPPISTEDLTMDDVPSLCEKVRGQMLDAYYRLSDNKEDKINNN